MLSEDEHLLTRETMQADAARVLVVCNTVVQRLNDSQPAAAQLHSVVDQLTAGMKQSLFAAMEARGYYDAAADAFHSAVRSWEEAQLAQSDPPSPRSVAEL